MQVPKQQLLCGDNQRHADAGVADAGSMGSTPRRRAGWGTAGRDGGTPCLSARAGTASTDWASPAGFLSARLVPVCACCRQQSSCYSCWRPFMCVMYTQSALNCNRANRSTNTKLHLFAHIKHACCYSFQSLCIARVYAADWLPKPTRAISGVS